MLFVGGKGGVGKTTVASAVALSQARRGRKVLLVSTDPAHSLGDLFDLHIGDEGREIRDGLMALEVDPQAEVDRYLSQVQATMREFVRPAMFAEVRKQIELTRDSPGAAEAALMDRISDLMARGRKDHDLVVFDTAPTGHTLRLLSLPEIMAAWTDGLLKSRDRSESMGGALERLAGRRRGEKGDDLAWFDDPEPPEEDPRSRKIRKVLLERRRKFARARSTILDRSETAFVLVLLPEKLPILESRKAVEVLRRHQVPIAGLVVNRVLPDEPLGSFLEQRREQEAQYLRQIDELFADLPTVRVPLLPQDVMGIQSLDAVAQHLWPDPDDSGQEKV